MKMTVTCMASAGIRRSPGSTARMGSWAADSTAAPAGSARMKTL